MDGSLSSIEMRIQKDQHSQSQLRFKIGQEPQYIQPKHHDITTSQPQILSESEFNSSVAVPNFHSPSLVESIGFSQKVQKQKKHQITEEFTEINQLKQSKLSGEFILLNILIWILYLIGSIDISNSKMSGFHVLDCIGNGLALVLVVFTIYAKKSLNSFCQILHIWSIILTLTYFLYPLKDSESSKQDGIFIQVINVLRCLRLGFPLFLKQSPISLGKRGFKIISSAKKIVTFVFIVCFLLGFFCYQTHSDSLGNRCRLNETSYALNIWTPIDDERLCGLRTCPEGSFCRNPKIFGFSLNQEEKQLKKYGQGLYTFDSSWHSAVSIFQMFTLNAWGRISQIFFDVYPSWITVPFYIIGFIVFEKLFMSLLVIFFDAMIEKRQKIHLLTASNKDKPDNSIHIAHDDIKIEFRELAISKIESSVSVAEKKNPNQEKQVQEQGKMSRRTKMILYGFALTLSIIHFTLASQFGLNPTKIDSDLINRKIGISLSIFFILQFITLCLIKYQFLQPSEEEEQSFIESNSTLLPSQHEYGLSQTQTIDTIMTLESFIFFVSLMDYLMRIVEGMFILEQPSGLTSLVHFLLALRIYYAYLALIDLFNFTALQCHLSTVVKTFRSIVKLVFVIVILSAILGAISYNINKDAHSQDQKTTAFAFEVNRFLTFIINHSWQNLIRFQISQGFKDQESLFVEIVGGLCLVFGSMIFMRFVVSQLIHEAFWEGLHIKLTPSEEKYMKDNNKSKTSIKSKQNAQSTVKTSKQLAIQQELDQMKTLQKEKSFLIFGFDNSLRQLALSIVKQEYYQDTIRFRFYIVYILINLVCCIACSSQVYGYISAVLECLILLDIILTALALRFFGRFSYSQSKIIPVIHFLSCFIILGFSLSQFQLQFVPLFQTLRILVILNYFESFKETFTSLQTISVTIFLHFLILIPIMFGYALIMLLVLSAKNENNSFFTKILQGFKLALILVCQKGWDTSRIFGEQNESTLFGQLTLFVMLIIWVGFVLSYFYSLGGIILSLLVKAKNTSEEQIKKQLCDSDSLLEEHKIKQKISKMMPKFNADLYASKCFLNICQHPIFEGAKRISCLGSIICFLILNISLSTNQRIAVYATHLFFFTCEILLFVFQSITYDRSQQHFWRDLILNILAVPGSYIGFVNPVQYSTGSYDMKIILLLFNALSMVRFVKVINYFSFLEKIYTFLKIKMSQTFNTFALMMVLTTAIGFYIYEIFGKQQSIVESLNYAFVGLVGGDFHYIIEKIIQRNHLQFTYEIHLLYLMVNLLNVVIKNLFLAFIIFEISDLAKERMSFTTTELSLYNFNKYFHENQIIVEWLKIDPEGKGFVNYRQILTKSHLFIRHFSITTLPYKSYLNRVQTFKKLKVPVYEAQIAIQKENCPKPQIRKEFVVTFYDFVFSMTKFAFREINSNKLTHKDKYFIKNTTFSDQPISIINIGSGDQYKVSNFSKKGVKLDRKQKKVEELRQQWRKKCQDLTKYNMTQKIEIYPEIQGFEAVLRFSKWNSEELYFAHRIKNKIYQYLRGTQVANEIKRHEEVHNFRNRKLTV